MQMTRTKPDGSWNVVGSSGDVVPWKDIPNELVGAIYKLHAYEKTGYSPRNNRNPRSRKQTALRWDFAAE